METKVWPGLENRDLEYEDLERLVARGRALRSRAICDMVAGLTARITTALKQLTTGDRPVKRKKTFLAGT